MAALANTTRETRPAVRSQDANELEGDTWAVGEIWHRPAADPLVPTSPEALDLPTILHALSDPIRLRIVVQLADAQEHTCGSFDLPIAKSTCSHHFRVLREAGVVAQRIDGKCRLNRLRADEIDGRFPGLLDAVLQASRA